VSTEALGGQWEVTRKVKPMHLLVRLCRGRARQTRLTRVVTCYRGSFPVGIADHDQYVELSVAWSSRSTIVLTDEAQVWEERTVRGPGIDRVPLREIASVSDEVGDITVTFPVTLGAALGTLVSTSPGELIASPTA
jgi:hypothetical protein